MHHKPGMPTATMTTGRRRLLAGLAVAAAASLVLVASIVSLAFAVTPSFPDVPSSHPYYAAITDLATRGIIAGYTNGDFGPGDDVNRQQFAKMIVLTGGYPVSEADICPFADVATGDAGTFYPDNYVAVCAANAITTGKTATTFDPYGKITRYQVVTMVVRAADDLQPGLLASPPTGWTATGAWANDPTHGANAARAEYNGLLANLDLAALSPTGNMNRGEVAQVLHNLIGKLTPATTTTTVPPTTTTSSSTTTTSSSTTTTTVASTTTTSPVTTSTTSTTLPVSVVAATDFAIAGLENSSVAIKVRDQFGNPFPNIEVLLTTAALEGSGLSLITDLSIGTTDAFGNVAYNWSQSTGDWGVEQVTAWLDDGTMDGLSAVVAVIQWIYDDRSTDYVGAVGGQQKVTVVSGYAAWNGLTLKAHLAPAAASIGSGTYVSSVALSLSTTTHTWSTGEAFFVGATSTNTDGKPNWMYNVAQ